MSFSDDFVDNGWQKKTLKNRRHAKATPGRDAGAKVVELCERRSDKEQALAVADSGANSGKKKVTCPHSNTGETVYVMDTANSVQNIKNDPFQFCDWLTVRVAIKHKKGILGDKILRIDPTGVTAWERDLWKTVENEASSSQVVSVKSLKYRDVAEPFLRMKQSGKMNWREMLFLRYGAAIDETTEDFLFLDISGNPTKFLQGQNVWGSNDMRACCLSYIKTILKQLNYWEKMTKKERENVENFHVWCTRFDLTTNFDLGNVADKNAFLSAVSKQAESKRGKKQAINTTTYFGSVEYLQVKFYDKSTEVAANLPKLNFQQSKDEQKDSLKYRKFAGHIHNEILGLVRCELRLGRGFLRKNCGLYLNSVLEYIEKGGLIMREVKKLKLGQHATKQSLKEAQRTLEALAAAKSLPRACVGIFVNWRNGETVQNLVARATFYKYRKLILEAVNIDISLVRTEEKKRRAKVVPLIREIEAAPAQPSQIFEDYIWPLSIHN